MFAKLQQRRRDAIGWLIYKLARVALLLVKKVKRIKLTVIGNELLPKKGPYVIAIVPHTSFVDGPLMFMVLRRRFIGVGMADLLSFREWHVFALAFRLMYHIPVQRDDPQSRENTLASGIATLQRGIPLFISPQGGIDRPIWRPGYAKMSFATGAPVVLVKLVGARAFMDEGPDGEWIFDWNQPMTVAVVAVLNPQNYSSVEMLDAEAQRIYDAYVLPE